MDGKKKTNKMHRREKSALEKYKDAALIAGYEISKEAYINPDKVIPIMNALSGYSMMLQAWKNVKGACVEF